MECIKDYSLATITAATERRVVMDRQCKCGSFDFFIQKQGSNTGLYCSICGKWQKWLNKDEVRLFENNRVFKKKNTKLITNAERIRKMTDEELAEWLTRITDDAQLDARTKCDYQWDEWLKEEVEEKDE